MKKIFTLIFAAIAIPALAGPDVAAYDLQERCGRRASEMFSFWRNEDSDASLPLFGARYTASYSARLNKCFAIYTSHYMAGVAPNRWMGRKMTLIDANSNSTEGECWQKEVGADQCYIGTRKFESMITWQEAAEAY